MDERDASARAQVRLHPAQVPVLYAWLCSVDLDQVPVGHPAHRLALMDLLTAIEADTGAHYATTADIAQARDRVAQEHNR
jgi:hypothetical protein